MERLECSVFGRVQGVGFRFFVQSTAKKLGLKGFVTNESGGSVKVVAEGPREKLEKLLSEIRKGPYLSKVEKVEEKWREARNGFESFFIDR